ncbi:hypothetical protein P7C70_g8440, partial [Phenoliferia sp. Uapishka_3]
MTDGAKRNLWTAEDEAVLLKAIERHGGPKGRTDPSWVHIAHDVNEQQKTNYTPGAARSRYTNSRCGLIKSTIIPRDPTRHGKRTHGGNSESSEGSGSESGNESVTVAPRRKRANKAKSNVASNVANSDRVPAPASEKPSDSAVPASASTSEASGAADPRIEFFKIQADLAAKMFGTK